MRQVTAAVIIENGRLFLARRPAGDPLAGLWELPGGKIEPGETPQECLERELREELSMAACAGHVLASTTYRYEHGEFELLALATLRRSTFRLCVHDRCAWVEPSDFGDYALAPADHELVQLLWGQAR